MTSRGLLLLAILVAALPAAVAAAAGAVPEAAASRPAQLEEFVRLQVGSFSSADQARQDARYDAITWHISEIWAGDGAAAGERWLYTESWMPDAPAPYMQRISRLEVDADGTLLARRYSLPDAARYVGGWQDPARFESLQPAQLVELPGCDALITRAGSGRFEGGTQGNRCRNTYKGASYAISQSVLTADGMINWDRGFSADGDLVWGPSAGGYRFRRTGETDACIDPVRMLVYGEIRDRKAFGAYARALAESGLYPQNGGYYEAMSPALEVFEGSPPPGRGVIIARFPCIEAARRFWNSDEYTEIRKLRSGIADFEVLVLPVPQFPRETPATAPAAPVAR